jgi:hypothetical protein
MPLSALARHISSRDRLRRRWAGRAGGVTFGIMELRAEQPRDHAAVVDIHRRGLRARAPEPA